MEAEKCILYQVIIKEVLYWKILRKGKRNLTRKWGVADSKQTPFPPCATDTVSFPMRSFHWYNKAYCCEITLMFWNVGHHSRLSGLTKIFIYQPLWYHTPTLGIELSYKIILKSFFNVKLCVSTKVQACLWGQPLKVVAYKDMNHVCETRWLLASKTRRMANTVFHY